MKRLFTVFLSAFAGATIGYVVHQVIDAKRNPRPAEERRPMVVGAPLTNGVAALVVGLASGKAGPVTAFASGLVTTALVGNLDDVVPGLGVLRRDQIDKIVRNARAQAQSEGDNPPA